MGMDTAQIGVEMGFNGTKVTDGLKKVSAGTNDLGKEMNKTGEALGKLGVMAGVFTTFGLAIKEVFDYSKNLTGALNENELAARNAAVGATELWGTIKNGALIAGANTVGFFNRIGEGLGEMAVKAATISGVLSAGSVKNMQEAERINEQERLRGEYMAKNAKAFNDISAGMKKAADESAAMDRAALTAVERRNLIEQELLQIRRSQNVEGLSVLDKQKLELAEAQKLLELKKEGVKVEAEAKKDAAAKAKADKETYDLGLEFYKLEEEVRQKMQEQEAEKRRVIAAESDAVNAAQLNTVAQEQTKRVMEEQTEELNRQAQIEKSRKGTFSITGSASSLSDYELNDRLSRENTRLQDIENAYNAGDNNQYFARFAQQSVLASLRKEKQNREEAAKIAEKSAEYDAKKGLGTQSETRALLEQLSAVKEINGVKQQGVEIDTRAVIAADNILNKAQGSLDAIKESLAQRTQEAPIVLQITQAAQDEAEAVTVTAQATAQAVVSYSKLTEIGAQYRPVAKELNAFEIVKTTEIKTQNSLLEDQATRIKSYALSQAQKELDLEKQITEEMQSRHAAAVKAQADNYRVKALNDSAALTNRTSAYKQYSGLAGSIESDLRNAAFQIENGSDPSGYYSGKLQAAGGLIQGKIAEATNAGTAYGFNSSEIVAQLQQLNTRLSANGLKIDGNT